MRLFWTHYCHLFSHTLVSLYLFTSKHCLLGEEPSVSICQDNGELCCLNTNWICGPDKPTQSAVNRSSVERGHHIWCGLQIKILWKGETKKLQLTSWKLDSLVQAAFQIFNCWFDDCRPVIRYRRNQYIVFFLSFQFTDLHICHNYVIWNYLHLGGFSAHTSIR